MPFSFNPFTGQLDYTDPNIVSGVAASLAYLQGNVVQLASNTANLEADQAILSANLVSLKSEYDALLISPLMTGLVSNTANNKANTTILFSSIAAANVEIANNTTHIGLLYANSVNQQAELQGLTVSISTLQNNVANNLGNIVNNYAFAGNNAAEILKLQANAVNLTANVVTAEFNIANNAANITILQANTTSLDANAIAQENKLINLKGNVIVLESDTANNTLAISNLVANTTNLIANVVNTMNITSSSVGAISNLTSNIISLEANTIAQEIKIQDLYDANSAMSVRVTNINSTYQSLPGLVNALTIQTVAANNSATTVNDLVTDPSTGIEKRLSDIEGAMSGAGYSMTTIINDRGNAVQNSSDNHNDIADLKVGLTNSSSGNLRELQGPFDNNYHAWTQTSFANNIFYYDANGFVRFNPL